MITTHSVRNKRRCWALFRENLKHIGIIALILFCMLCSGCGFQVRSKDDFPKELNTVYFSSGKPYSVLSEQLNELFQSMDVRLAKTRSDARFSIILSHDNFSYSRPDMVNTTLPTNLNFMQSATLIIINNKTNTMIGSRSFSTSQSLTLNANQIYTNNANHLIQYELNRQIVSMIYYWLISKNTKDALHDTTISQTTRHAS